MGATQKDKRGSPCNLLHPDHHISHPLQPISPRPARRRLVDDVHGMLSAHLEDTFFCFLGEAQQLEPGHAAAQVGGHRVLGVVIVVGGMCGVGTA